MADRFPLILNTSANQIQEIASGDTLDLSGTNIKGVGIITATNLSGNIIAGAGTSNIVSGILTAVAADIDDFIDVGSNIQLGNAGVVTATTFSGSGASLTGIANVNVASNAAIAGSKISPNFGTQTLTAGLGYFTNNLNTTSNFSMTGGNVQINLQRLNHTPDYRISLTGGSTSTMEFRIRDTTNNLDRFIIKHTGGVEIPGDLDVDGHTNLDNVSIAGVTTFAGASTINNLLYVKGAESTDGIIALYADEGDDNNDMWRLRAGANAAFYIDNYANGAWQTNLSATATSTQLYSAGYTKVNTTTNGINVYNGESGGTTTINVTKGSGDAEVVCQRTGGSGVKLRGSHPASFLETTTDSDLYVRRNTSTRIALGSNGNTIYGNTTFQNGITGTTASFSGNVSVGGVLTYEDVVNVDSVGIVTARSGVFIPDNNRLHIGNTSGTGDLQLYHNGTDSRIHSLTNTLSVRANIFNIRRYTDAQYFVNCTSSGVVELYKSNVKKLETTSSGISVTGRADISTGLAVGSSGVQSSNVVSIKGSVNNQLNIADSTNNNWGLLLTQSQHSGGYHTSTNLGVSKPCAIVNVQNDALNFGTNNTMRWTMDHLGHFYPGGNGHLDIGKSTQQVKTIFATGAVVSGVVTATSYTGDGSQLTGVSVGITTEQVTPASNVATLDLTKDDHKIVASGTYTIDVTGGTEADSHVIRIENSGTANVGFSTYFKFPSGGTPALPTASGAISLISFSVHKVGSVGIATVLLAGASVNYS